MFYLGKKNWFGSKHAIVSEQFLFVTETSQTAASIPKQKKKKRKNVLVILLFVQPSSSCSIWRYFDWVCNSSSTGDIWEVNFKELNLKEISVIIEINYNKLQRIAGTDAWNPILGVV